MPRRGLLVAGAESPALRELLSRAPCRVETFGLDAEATWRAEELSPGEHGWSFRLRHKGCDVGRFRLGVPGEHNVRNALAALALAAEVGVTPHEVGDALAAFRGVRRRLELRGEAAGVKVYDDFAHHPSAVREALRGLRAGLRDGGRLVAVFEPRSYTARTNIFQDAFAEHLALADLVVVAPVYHPERLPVDRRLSEPELVQGVQRCGRQAVFLPGVEPIVEHLSAVLRDGDQVVVLSNGGFGGIHERLLAALDARSRDAEAGVRR